MVTSRVVLARAPVASMVGVVEVEVLELLVEGLPPLLGESVEVLVLVEIVMDVASSNEMDVVGDGLSFHQLDPLGHEGSRLYMEAIHIIITEVLVLSHKFHHW